MWIWCIIPLLISCHAVGSGVDGEGGNAVCVGVCSEVEGEFGVALKESWVCCVGFGVGDKPIFIIISMWNKWCDAGYTSSIK